MKNMLKMTKNLAFCLLTLIGVLLYSCTTESDLDTVEVTEEEELSFMTPSSLSFKTSSAGHHYVGNLENVLGDVK